MIVLCRLNIVPRLRRGNNTIVYISIICDLQLTVNDGINSEIKTTKTVFIRTSADERPETIIEKRQKTTVERSVYNTIAHHITEVIAVVLQDSVVFNITFQIYNTAY